MLQNPIVTEMLVKAHMQDRYREARKAHLAALTPAGRRGLQIKLVLAVVVALTAVLIAF